MKNMTLYNFHSHTTRCGHAIGEDEEYILNAIKEGFVYYGVSDHVMFPFLDQIHTRGNYERDFPSYIKSINYLKEKYREQIELHLGMEVEYSKVVDDYYRSLLNEHLEYLIMGQHFHMDDSRYFHSYSEYSHPGSLYVDDVIEGMRSGLILYVAHPDIIIYFADPNNEDLEELFKRLIKEAKRTKTPLELNVSKVEIKRAQGIENPEEVAPFPISRFWEIAGEEQVDVVIGLDCHQPRFVNKNGFKYAMDYAKRHHLKAMTPKQILKRMKNIKENIKKATLS